MFRYRTTLQQNKSVEELVRELSIVYSTDRPSSPILPILSDGHDRRCEHHIVKTYVPSADVIHDINPLLFRQSIDVLRKELPVIPEERLSELSENTYWSAASKLMGSVLDTYYALLIYMGTDNREQAFQIVIDQLDKRLNPEKCFMYYGTYLYNFEMDSPTVASVELSEGIEIRLTTHEDLARELHTSNLFDYELNVRKFLPPPYYITIHNTIPSYLASVLVPAIYAPPEKIDNVICALRLHQANYVGRDRVHGWIAGLLPTSLSGGSIVDATARQFARGIPDARENLPTYRLNITDVDEIKKTLQALETPTGKSMLNIAITRFNDSYSRGDAKERIIDLVIALENLFGEETTGQTTEVGYRLRMRAAKYLGKTSNEKKEIMEFLRSVYNLRSKIVHGSSNDVDETIKNKLKMTMNEVVVWTEDIVRRALRKMLRNPSHIGQAYQNDLLLGATE